MGLAASKQEAFWEACGFGHKDRVRKFIAEGIDVNWVSYTRGNTALHHAAMKGHTEIINMLIDAGVEINAQDKNGWTALINAAYWCHPAAIKLLIRRSCNVHLENKEQRSALHEACRSKETDEQGLADIVKMLVDANCDIDSKSSDVGEADFTPLMFCGYHGHAQVAKVLIEASCDINAQGSNGWSALHWAASRNHVEVARVLLEGGICPVLTAEKDREELAIDRATNNEIREMIAEAIEYYKRSQVVETDDELDATDSEAEDYEEENEKEVEEMKDTADTDNTQAAGVTADTDNAQAAERECDTKDKDVDQKETEKPSEVHPKDTERDSKDIEIDSKDIERDSKDTERGPKDTERGPKDTENEPNDIEKSDKDAEGDTKENKESESMRKEGEKGCSGDHVEDKIADDNKLIEENTETCRKLEHVEAATADIKSLQIES